MCMVLALHVDTYGYVCIYSCMVGRIARSALCHVLYMEKEMDNEHESEYCKLTLCSASFICSVRSSAHFVNDVDR